MGRLDRIPPPHRWGAPARAALLAATVLPLILVCLVPVGIGLLLLADPPASARYLVGYLLATLLLYLAATVPTLALYVGDARANPQLRGDLRRVWLALHLVLAQLAMIPYWFMYLRRPSPHDEREAARQSPAA